MALYYVLLTVGYQLIQSMTHTGTISPLNVNLTTIYPTHHTSTCPLLTCSVSLTGLVCYVNSVNKVSVLYLVYHDAKSAPIFLLVDHNTYCNNRYCAGDNTICIKPDCNKRNYQHIHLLCQHHQHKLFNFDTKLLFTNLYSTFCFQIGFKYRDFFLG